ncbi:hypothetical protein [Roseateles sp. MS654]|uniref:hypothetical protein n=1 Tax=Roseateles sp. MS654 TaxID=3412685 RepID=UPI003C2BBF6B
MSSDAEVLYIMMGSPLNSMVLSHVRERAGEAIIQRVEVSGRCLLLDLSNGDRESLNFLRLNQEAAMQFAVNCPGFRGGLTQVVSSW